MIRTINQGMWTVGIRDTVYVTYSIQQSCGWVKVGEFAFAEMEQADRFIQDTTERCPQDVARFEKRVA
jgi:hypothetical protein